MPISSGTRNKKMVGVDTTAFTPKITPPESMTADGKKLWKQLVESIPNENLCLSDMPILEIYCETMVTFRKSKQHVDLQGEVIISESTGNNMVNPWFTVMINAAGRITSLSTKLRLSPSSRMKADNTKGQLAKSVPVGGEPSPLSKLIHQ